MQHLTELRGGYHHSIYLQSSYNKHGEGCFKFEVIEHVSDKSVLTSREQYWMDYLKCYVRDFGYNMCPIAGSTKGKKHRESTKKRMSEVRKKEGSYWYGKKLTKETKEKLSKSHIGKTHTEDSKRKIRERLRGEGGANAKLNNEKVIQIKTILKDSNLKQKEIAEIFGVNPVTIGDIKRGKSWSHIIL